MAKLEELSELLVSEIRDFEEGITRLEKLQQNKVTIDITNLQEALGNHEKTLFRLKIENEKYLKRMEAIHKKIHIYLKLTIVFCIISIIIYIFK